MRSTSSGFTTRSRPKVMVSVTGLGTQGWGQCCRHAPEASGAKASPLEEMLVREVHPYVFLSFLNISLMVPKDGQCAIYSCMIKGVPDEALDGHDAYLCGTLRLQLSLSSQVLVQLPIQVGAPTGRGTPAKRTDFPVASLRLRRDVPENLFSRWRSTLLRVKGKPRCGDLALSPASQRQPSDSRGRRCRVWGVVMSGLNLR